MRKILKNLYQIFVIATKELSHFLLFLEYLCCIIWRLPSWKHARIVRTKYGPSHGKIVVYDPKIHFAKGILPHFSPGYASLPFQNNYFREYLWILDFCYILFHCCIYFQYADLFQLIMSFIVFCHFWMISEQFSVSKSSASKCCLAFAYFFPQFQPGVTYKSVAYKKKACIKKELRVSFALLDKVNKKNRTVRAERYNWKCYRRTYSLVKTISHCSKRR